MRRSSLRPRAAPPLAAQAEAGGAKMAAARAARRARAAERAREVEEPAQVVRDKVRTLAQAVLTARHLVVYTGAGVSTAARIPDYRGPRGVWTGLARGRPPPRVDVAAATPTLTHMALAALWRAGAMRFLVSQNCDGLHLRSGVPRRALAELHGDMFVESCGACDTPHLRRFDTTERTARHRHRTRRLCRSCGHELRDTIVHFGERGRARWPLNWRGAVAHARRADVLLVLGSSLKVLRRYPRLWPRRRRPRLFIVNLQWTPKDAVAELKISARCDDVMRLLLRELGVRVPAYSPRRDPLFAHCTPLLPRERHTTRRRPLPTPPHSSSPSPATTDSEDNTPLRQIADDLRSNDSQPLCSFEVQLCSGAASILLQPKHAPSAVRPLRPPPPLLPLRVHNGEGALPLKSVSKLRQFRRVKPPHKVNGHNGYVNGHALVAHLGTCKREHFDNKDGIKNEPPLMMGIKHDPPLMGDKHEPPPMGVKHEPPLMGVKHGPPLMGEKHEPPLMGVKHEPPLMGVKHEPPLMGVKHEPPLMGVKHEPPLMGVKHEPPLMGVKHEPPLMGVKHEPPLMGVKHEPPRKGVKRLPETKNEAVPFESKMEAGHLGNEDERRLVAAKHERRLNDTKERCDGDTSEDAGVMRECVTLARAIIAHALVMCRAQLYPGLHNIIIPAPAPARPAPPPRVQCEWCRAQLGSKRCLFYARAQGDGVPRAEDGRWCACCEPGDGVEEGSESRADAADDTGGWYGKGYAKIRRKRR